MKCFSLVSLLVLVMLPSSCKRPRTSPFGEEMQLGTMLYVDLMERRSQSGAWPQSLSEARLHDRRFPEAVCSGHCECFAGTDNKPPSLMVIIHHARGTLVNLVFDGDEWQEKSDVETNLLIKSADRHKLELCPKK